VKDIIFRVLETITKTDVMLKRTKPWVMALVVFVMITFMGCGTIITRYVSPNWSPPDPPLPRIYSGTIFDYRCLLHPEMYDTQGIRGFCLVDAAFSIMADTVIIPLTIYEQVKYGSYAADKPADSNK
jgi:uncharacterized protein YceK